MVVAVMVVAIAVAKCHRHKRKCEIQKDLPHDKKNQILLAPINVIIPRTTIEMNKYKKKTDVWVLVETHPHRLYILLVCALCALSSHQSIQVKPLMFDGNEWERMENTNEATTTRNDDEPIQCRIKQWVRSKSAGCWLLIENSDGKRNTHKILQREIMFWTTPIAFEFVFIFRIHRVIWILNKRRCIGGSSNSSTCQINKNRISIAVTLTLLCAGVLWNICSVGA